MEKKKFNSNVLFLPFHPTQSLMYVCAQTISTRSKIDSMCKTPSTSVGTDWQFCAPLSIEMYLATSGTFSVAGYEVCQVSPRRIESTLVCIPTKGKGRIGLNQLRTHRELEQGLVPEWRVKYFDYKVGWLAKRTRQCFDRWHDGDSLVKKKSRQLCEHWNMSTKHQKHPAAKNQQIYLALCPTFPILPPAKAQCSILTILFPHRRFVPSRRPYTMWQIRLSRRRNKMNNLRMRHRHLPSQSGSRGGQKMIYPRNGTVVL